MIAFLIIIGWLLLGWLGGRMAIQHFRHEFPGGEDATELAILLTILGPVGLVVAIIASDALQRVITPRFWGIKEKDNVRTR